MSNFTPGPWEWLVNDDESVDCLIGPEESVHGRGVGSPVIVGSHIVEDEDGDPVSRLGVKESDRTLIKASPNLLAALQAMVKWEQCRPGGFPCPHLEQANAAISEALGTSTT